jgi:4'-phosphopantetheinyl transferase
MDGGSSPPLDCPISVFGGLHDATITLPELDAWRERTSGPFCLELFPGDRFFPFAPGGEFLPALTRGLGEAAGRAGPVGGPLATEGEVHVWLARLDRGPDEIRALGGILSEDERFRAERFCFPRDRDRFIAGRGILRTILAEYLNREPGQLRFASNPYGKPALAAVPEESPPLCFNVTHSEGLALYAVTRTREVGIDLEWAHRELDLQAIAERFFSPREAAGLGALPPEARREAFFACWTRKEAYVKARGQGLSLALDGFSVSLAVGGPPEHLRAAGNAHGADDWSVYGFTPVAGYSAALAVASPAWTMQWRHWPARARA